MALNKSYLTVNGTIRSEQHLGESGSRDFIGDGLGNTVAVYKHDYLQADACYSPYGEIYSQWNIVSGEYRFAWLGGWGYRKSNSLWSNTYVRARHYSVRDGAWTTVDALWPEEMPYAYSGGRPLTYIDPSGQIPVACALACAGAAACAIDLWLVCKDWEDDGFSSFRDCWDGVWNELPGWLQAGCSIGLEACISCLTSAAGKLIKPGLGKPAVGGPKPNPGGGPKPTPNTNPKTGSGGTPKSQKCPSKPKPKPNKCREAMAARDAFCGRPNTKSPKMSCKSGCGRPTDKGYCTCLHGRWTAGGLCIAARRAVTKHCYNNTWDKSHWGEVQTLIGVNKDCVKKMKDAKCPPFNK